MTPFFTTDYTDEDYANVFQLTIKQKLEKYSSRIAEIFSNNL
jgi:hypothetical protein